MKIFIQMIACDCRCDGVQPRADRQVRDDSRRQRRGRGRMSVNEMTSITVLAVMSRRPLLTSTIAHLLLLLSQCHFITTTNAVPRLTGQLLPSSWQTRSSAIAEGPRDALCQSCQLLHCSTKN